MLLSLQQYCETVSFEKLRVLIRRISRQSVGLITCGSRVRFRAVFPNANQISKAGGEDVGHIIVSSQKNVLSLNGLFSAEPITPKNLTEILY